MFHNTIIPSNQLWLTKTLCDLFKKEPIQSTEYLDMASGHPLITWMTIGKYSVLLALGEVRTHHIIIKNEKSFKSRTI